MVHVTLVSALKRACELGGKDVEAILARLLIGLWPRCAVPGDQGGARVL